jgi:hypothetical protein
MHRIVAAAAATCAVGLAGLESSPAAQADCGFGPPFMLDLGRHPRLAPTLPATERLDCADLHDGKEYDYAVRGYFEVK